MRRDSLAAAALGAVAFALGAAPAGAQAPGGEPPFSYYYKGELVTLEPSPYPTSRGTA